MMFQEDAESGGTADEVEDLDCLSFLTFLRFFESAESILGANLCTFKTNQCLALKELAL